MALALAACVPLGLAGRPAPSGRPTPAISPSAAPSTEPATASPTPGAGPHVVSIQVEPASATLYVLPPAGVTPIYATEQQMAAIVTMSDGSTSSAVDWSTREADRANVSDTGLVISGREPGAVLIEASTADGTVTAAATFSIKDDAGAQLTVN